MIIVSSCASPFLRLAGHTPHPTPGRRGDPNTNHAGGARAGTAVRPSSTYVHDGWRRRWGGRGHGNARPRARTRLRGCVRCSYPCSRRGGGRGRGNGRNDVPRRNELVPGMYNMPPSLCCTRASVYMRTENKAPRRAFFQGVKKRNLFLLYTSHLVFVLHDGEFFRLIPYSGADRLLNTATFFMYDRLDPRTRHSCRLETFTCSSVETCANVSIALRALPAALIEVYTGVVKQRLAWE